MQGLRFGPAVRGRRKRCGGFETRPYIRSATRTNLCHALGNMDSKNKLYFGDHRVIFQAHREKTALTMRHLGHRMEIYGQKA